MALSSSFLCNDDDDDDDNHRGIFFDDSMFKGEADSLTYQSTSSSSSTQRRFNFRKRRGDEYGVTESEICKNCGANCLVLIFDCACTVECALGYFKKRKKVNNFLVVSANFRFIRVYRNLEILPRSIVFDSTKETCEEFLERAKTHLYSSEDPRYPVYLQQLKDNQVTSVQSKRDVLRRIT